MAESGDMGWTAGREFFFFFRGDLHSYIDGVGLRVCGICHAFFDLEDRFRGRVRMAVSACGWGRGFLDG